MKLQKIACAAWVVGALGASGAVLAAQQQKNMTVKIVVVGTCSAMSNIPDMTFPQQTGAWTGNVDASAAFSVTCTNNYAYSWKADNGANAAGSPPQRNMKSGTNLIPYKLYSNAARTDEVSDTTVVNRTGTGAAETVTIYGRVAGQASPTVGTYTDTVQVTLTY